MDLATLFQYVPKLALVLLIIIGGLIVVEIINIIRDKRPKPKEASQKTISDNLQPIQFQEQVEMVTVPLPVPRSKNRLRIPIVLLSIVTIAIIAVAVFRRQSETEPAQPIVTPTPEEQPLTIAPTSLLASPSAFLTSTPEASPSSIIVPPVIKVYQIDKKKAWIQLTHDTLAKLKPNDEIFIAIATPKDYTKALFTINGEEIVYVKDKQLNPYQEGYIRYTIPATTTEFTIEVILLNE